MSQGHHILSVKSCRNIFVTLLFLTVATVVAAQIDIGVFNFPLAMLIATIKACFVMFYFMGLKFDTSENRIIFFSSLIFVAIFITMVYSDFLFRQKEAPVDLRDVHNSKQNIEARKAG